MMVVVGMVRMGEREGLREVGAFGGLVCVCGFVDGRLRSVQNRFIKGEQTSYRCCIGACGMVMRC